MPARPRRSLRTAVPAVVAGLLLLLAAAAPASAAPPQPRVAFPTTGVPAGAEADAVSAAIENPRGAQRIGSANLVPPAGFKVLGATLSGTGAGGGTAEVRADGTLVALRTLALAANTSLQVRLTLQAPCRTVPPSRWGVTVKGSASFDGDSIAIAPASTLVTATSGTCTLRWGDPLPPPATADDREPADAKVGAVITSVAHVESAPPVRVAVHDGANRRVRSAVGAVEVVLTGAGGGTDLRGAGSALGGPDGYAAFPALRVDDKGTYGLRASVTSERFAGLTSKTVVIRGDTVVKGCDAFGPCPTGSLVEGAGVGPAGYSVSAPSGQRATFLTLSVDAGVSLSAADCGGWAGYAGSTALFNETSNTRTTVIAATVDKVEMNREAENGAPRLELCFAAPKSFPTKDKDGVFGTAKLSSDTFDWNADGRAEPIYTGLLRNCPIAGKPCITQRKKVGSLDGLLSESGNGYIEAIVPAGLGDPAMRP